MEELARRSRAGFRIGFILKAAAAAAACSMFTVSFAGPDWDGFNGASSSSRLSSSSLVPHSSQFLAESRECSAIHFLGQLSSLLPQAQPSRPSLFQ